MSIGPERMVAGSGRGVRIAVIDSGVHAAHPHVQGVAGGIAIAPDGAMTGDYIDRLGHGTAVTAAIKEKAPEAEVYAVKIFDRVLSADAEALTLAIDWATRFGVHLVNLSLGTPRADREQLLAGAVARAMAAGVVVVAAAPNDGIRWLPGALAGVLPVGVDWTCPRDRYGADMEGGRIVFRASGYPREIPGVPPQRNLNGVSFAVANMTGFAAQALTRHPGASFQALLNLLSKTGAGVAQGLNE